MATESMFTESGEDYNHVMWNALGTEYGRRMQTLLEPASALLKEAEQAGYFFELDVTAGPEGNVTTWRGGGSEGATVGHVVKIGITDMNAEARLDWPEDFMDEFLPIDTFLHGESSPQAGA